MARRPRESLPFLHLLPNMVTILGLCAGLTSIRFAMDGHVTIAAALIVFSALIDGLDGLLARRLRATSEFGAELDSLSDFVCFGVAPALLVFRYGLHTDMGMGWIFGLVYAICCCLRLARFNVSRGNPETAHHFVGVPAPAGAALALVPIFAANAGLFQMSQVPLMVGIWLGVVGLLMVSRVPTPSIKGVRVQREHAAWIMVGMALFVGLLLTMFWLTLFLICMIYLSVVIFQGLRHRRF